MTSRIKETNRWFYALSRIVIATVLAGVLAGAGVPVVRAETDPDEPPIRSVSWYYKEPLSGGAFRIDFDIGPEGACEIDLGMAGTGADSDGPTGTLLKFKDGELESWLFTSQSWSAGAQGPSGHTSEVFREVRHSVEEVLGRDHWGVRSWGEVTESQTYLLAGRTLFPWPDDLPGEIPWPAHASLWIDVDCDETSSIELAASREVLLFDGKEMDSGTVAYENAPIFGEVVVTLDGQATRDFASSAVDVFAGFASGGDVMGSLTIDHPSETTTWDLHDPSYVYLDDGPGRYDFHLDRISIPCGNVVAGNGGCNLWDTFIVGAWGLNPIRAPEEVLDTPSFSEI